MVSPTSTPATASGSSGHHSGSPWNPARTREQATANAVAHRAVITITADHPFLVVLVWMGLTAQAANQRVWRPDGVSSICFLVACAMTWFQVCHGWVGRRPR